MPTATRTDRLAVPVLLGSGGALAAGGLLALTVDGWVVRLLGGLALVVGAYVALVGVGVLRVRRAVARQAAADRDTDQRAARILAEVGALTNDASARAEACGDRDQCAACTAECALSALRAG